MEPVQIPNGYRVASWSELKPDDWVWIARWDVGQYSYAAVRLQVVDPEQESVVWYKREHYDYGRSADMIPIITPIDMIYKGGLTDWPGIIRIPLLRCDPEGFRPATEADLVIGREVWCWGTDRGEGRAYGPHTYHGYLSGHMLKNTHGRVFREDTNFILVRNDS